MIQPSCKDRVKHEWAGRREDLEKLLENPDNEVGGLGTLSEYGLCIDYVEAGTFTNQKRGYTRYQFSWGGPGDELRIYRRGRGIDKIEYWFLDWFDGASLNVTHDKVAIKAADYALGVF